MSSIFGTAAKGMVAATGMTLLMWPVVDRVGFPYLVKESITQRDKGNSNPSEIANKIESLRKQYANDRSGVWLFLQLSESDASELCNELSDSTANITIQGISDSRLLLYSVLSRICEPLGCVGQISLAYIKAMNVFGDVVTGNTRHDHTTFMFYNLILDHVRRGLENYQRQKQTRPLVVVGNFSEICKVARTDATQHKVVLESTRSLLKWLQERGVIDVVVLADISTTFKDCESIVDEEYVRPWLSGANTFSYWLQPDAINYENAVFPYPELPYRVSKFFNSNNIANSCPRVLARSDIKSEHVSQLLSDRVICRVVGTELFSNRKEMLSSSSVLLVPGEAIKYLSPMPYTMRSIYDSKTINVVLSACILFFVGSIKQN